MVYDMPLSPQRQRELARKYYRYATYLPNKPATLQLAAADADWWFINCSILPSPGRFHFWRVDGVWRFMPYVDTTATERAIDASVKRYRQMYGPDA